MKKLKYFLLIFLLLFTFNLNTLFINAEDDKIETILNVMTNEEKIALMIMPSVDLKYSEIQSTTSYNTSYTNAITNYNFAGFILYGGAVPNIEESIRLTNYLQQLNKDHKTRLLIAIDQEGGYVSRLGVGTTLLGNMGLAATTKESNAYDAGVIIGKELKALGINLNFSPVVDINMNPSNPIIGIRSFSDSPELVAKFGKSMMNGLKDSGVITTLKHYPGQGDSDKNFEKNRGNIDKTKEELRNSELIPFIELIKNDAEVIMTSHSSYSNIETGTYESILDGVTYTLPATLSKTILTNILRDELGYKGVIISDAMNMKAISDNFEKVDARVKAINAGVDIILEVLKPSELANIGDLITTLADKIGTEINEENVNNSVRRILKLKEKYGLLNDYTDPDETTQISNAKSLISTKENHTTEFNMAKEAVTMVKNDNNLLPLKETDKTLILYYYSSHLNVINTALNYLLNDSEISDISNIDSFRLKTNITNLEAAKAKIEEGYDNVVIMNSFYDDSNINGTVSPRIDQLIEHAHNNNQKVIYMSTHLPYDASRFQSAEAILCTYLANGVSYNLDDYETNYPKYSANTIAGVYMLFAKSINFNGKLPVNVYKISDDNNYYTRTILYERGYGLKKLDPANYQTLDNNINSAKELINETIYTEDTMNNLKNIYNDSVTFRNNYGDLLEDKQSDIDDIANRLKTAIDSLKKLDANIEELTNSIKKAESILKISNVYTKDTINSLKNAYNKAIELINNGNLTIDRQNEVDSYTNDIKNAISALKIATLNNNTINVKADSKIEEKKEDPKVIEDSFEIISGKNQTIEDKELNIKLSNTNKLTKVIVDNKELDKVDYSINKEENIFTLKSNYIKTLDEGKHEITFVFGDKKISTNFFIKLTKEEESSSGFNIIPFIITGVIVTVLAVLGLIFKKKKESV